MAALVAGNAVIAKPARQTCLTECEPAPPAARQSDKLRGRAVYFVRITQKPVTDKTVEQDIAAGQISGTPLDSFRSLMTELFVPVLKEQGNWGKTPDESVSEFMQARPHRPPQRPLPPSQPITRRTPLRCAARARRTRASTAAR